MVLNTTIQFHSKSNSATSTKDHLRTVAKIVSPSMAMAAEEDNNTCFGVDPSQLGAIKHCNGWMKHFKNYTSALSCVNFNGERSNCWDVIDSIQIHAYARTAQEVLDKIRAYYEVFKDDFDGVNGRTKKTLCACSY